MSKYRRQRIAFWSDQTLGIVIGVASIFAASRIGFQKAVGFARVQEMRRTRDLIRTIDDELAVNEDALRRALASWETEEFRHLHVVSRNFEKARGRTEYFFIDPAATEAVQAFYGQPLRRVIEQLRKTGGGPASRFFAIDLGAQLEKLEVARPLLAKEIARIVGELADAGYHEPIAVKEVAAVTTTTVTPEEQEILARRSSDGWTTGPQPYKGELPEVIHPAHAGALPLARGPLYVGWEAPSRSDAKWARAIVTFHAKVPAAHEHKLKVGIHDDAMRRFLSGEGAVATFAHAWTGSSGELVIPSRPDAWRWVSVSVEDEQGVRTPVEPVCGRAGRDEPRKHWWKPDEKALVLPR